MFAGNFYVANRQKIYVMTENEEFIYESIRDQVWMGFLSFEELQENLFEEIDDNGFEKEIPEEWANKWIQKELAKQARESKDWKKPTDTQRLIDAFDELAKNNIIALHNAGYTSTDGHIECVEVERSLREKGMESEGYCFYHEQDLMRAIDQDEPSLYIAFNKVDNEDDAVTIQVGKTIVAILRKYRFEVDWDEVSNKRILLPNFRWQKCFNPNDRDILDYDQIVRLMTLKK